MPRCREVRGCIVSALGHANRLREVAAMIRRDDPDAGYDCDKAAAELERLHALSNTPHTHDFIEAVQLEMPHQRERWGAEHDAGKRPEDWITLAVYLIGKASKAHFDRDAEKLKHHVITTAAALGNWFLNMTGEDTRMRPGIADETAAPRFQSFNVPVICPECGWEVSAGSHGSDCSQRRSVSETAETNAPRVECKCDRCGRESFEARMIGVLCGEASYNHVCYGRMRAAPSEEA